MKGTIFPVLQFIQVCKLIGVLQLFRTTVWFICGVFSLEKINNKRKKVEKDNFYHNPDHLIMIGSKSWERKVCYSHIFSVNLLPVQSLNNTALISTVVWFCRCLHCCCCMCNPPFVINRSANHSWFWKEIDPEIYLVNPLQRIHFSLNRSLAGVCVN